MAAVHKNKQSETYDWKSGHFALLTASQDGNSLSIVWIYCKHPTYVDEDTQSCWQQSHTVEL
jgi:hypothetical protein